MDIADVNQMKGTQSDGVKRGRVDDALLTGEGQRRGERALEGMGLNIKENGVKK